jgi:hypothetical protein
VVLRLKPRASYKILNHWITSLAFIKFFYFFESVFAFLYFLLITHSSGPWSFSLHCAPYKSFNLCHIFKTYWRWWWSVLKFLIFEVKGALFPLHVYVWRQFNETHQALCDGTGVWIQGFMLVNRRSQSRHSVTGATYPETLLAKGGWRESEWECKGGGKLV